MKHHLPPYLFFLLLSAAAVAEGGEVLSVEGFEIHLAGVNEREKKVAEVLIDLSQKHDLSPWLFINRVRIESGVIPHSHPILTLNTRYIEKSTQLLAVFLHEQIHWFLAAPENRKQMKDALSELRRMYPEVPNARNGGAASDYSTYLHLLVNWLEFDALSKLLGQSEAQEVIAKRDIYEWIYGRVLEDSSQLKSIATRHDLRIAHECR
ncbi:MAG: hypothetical protein U5L08_10325 [Xanthomonadales bacterium]|nr:hypothetical protein [Xanthomonadales bacterium]